jgi:effector-binding domain-containing protein
MEYLVSLQTVRPRILVAVRRRVAIKDIPTAFKPALDQVWAFLRQHSGLRTDGHNIFLYHHESPEIMPIDFGVEVVRSFVGEGDVTCVTTPAGEAAVVVHRGPYSQLMNAH